MPSCSPCLHQPEHVVNLHPQSPLFESSSSRMSRLSGLLERQRKWSSYIAASLLGVPLGMLPWLISRAISGGSSQIAGTAASGPVSAGVDALLLLPVPIVAIIFIVVANLNSDGVYRSVNDRLRQRLRSTDLPALVLDDSRLAALRQNLRKLPLPQGLSLESTSTLHDKLEFFAHYHRQLTAADLDTASRSYMAVRQEMWFNLFICAACSALCFLFMGYLLLPFIYRRIFVSWPSASAARVSFAQFLAERNIS